MHPTTLPAPLSSARSRSNIMFTLLGFICLVLAGSHLVIGDQGPLVRLDNAVGYHPRDLHLVDIEASQLEGLHRVDQRELDQLFRHSFCETAVRITYNYPFLLRPDSSSAQEAGVSTSLNLTIRTVERSTLLHMGRAAHSRPPTSYHLTGWIHKYYSSSSLWRVSHRALRAKTV
jgi:hypothetical protein